MAANDERPGATRFDASLGAWVVSRRADVVAALRDPRLTAGNATSDSSAHAEVRAAATRALSPAHLAAWRAEFMISARRAVDALPREVPVDLVRDFAAPWSLAVASTVTGTPPDVAAQLAEPARTLFLAAATATDASTTPAAQRAAAALALALQGASAWPDVQAFVALSQTLPSALAGVWERLLATPSEPRRLRADRALIPSAVDTLLRRAGPSRAVFRRAAVDISLGTDRIAAGDRVVLRLAAADRDPDGDDVKGHLAFGRGAHACPGAPVVRLALAAATEALLHSADDVTPLGEAVWEEGFAIRVAVSLPVVLRRA